MLLLFFRTAEYRAGNGKQHENEKEKENESGNTEHRMRANES
jgi:hypothetical protein